MINLFSQFSKNVIATLEERGERKDTTYSKQLEARQNDANPIEVIKTPNNRLVAKLRKGYLIAPKRVKYKARKLTNTVYKREVTLKLNGAYTSLEHRNIARDIGNLIDALKESKMRRITVFQENLKELKSIRYVTIETKRKKANRDRNTIRNKGSFPEKIQGKPENAEYCQYKRVKNEYHDYDDIQNIVSITVNGKLIIGKRINSVKQQKINHNKTSIQFPSLNCYQYGGQYGISGAVFYIKVDGDHKLSKYAVNGYIECSLKLLSNWTV